MAGRVGATDQNFSALRYGLRLCPKKGFYLVGRYTCRSICLETKCFFFLVSLTIVIKESIKIFHF